MRDYSFISPRSDEFALRSLARYSVQELSREAPFNELQRMFRSRCDEIISTILIRVMTKRRRQAYLTPVGIFWMMRCNNVIVANDEDNERADINKWILVRIIAHAIGTCCRADADQGSRKREPRRIISQ